MARREDDEDAPWLAEAGPARQTRVSRRSFFWTAVILVALAAVIAIGLLLLLAKKDGGSTQGYMNAEQAPLIAALPGPYKVPPADPKGLAVEGQDQTIYAAGEGIDEASVIDESARPEDVLPRPGTEPPGLPVDLMPEVATLPTPAVPATVVPRPQATAPPRPTPRPQPQPAPEATVKPAPAPAATPAAAPRRPGSIQLGAFSSLEKAEAAWGPLAAKYGLSGKRIVAIESGGRTLYRLRAGSADIAATCARINAAGDACKPVE